MNRLVVTFSAITLVATVAATAILVTGYMDRREVEANRAAAEAAQAAANRFDLICDVTVNYPAFRATTHEQSRFTFDLGEGYWSEHFHDSSQNPQFIHAVTDDEIDLSSETFEFVINRTDGTLTGGTSGANYSGQCERQPFTPFDQIPTRRF